MEKIITCANSTTSSICGEIGVVVQEAIRQKFPQDFFKYVNISSEIASRNMRRVFGSNTNTEMVKRERPSLAIQPMYSTMGENEPMQNIVMTTGFENMYNGIYRNSLFRVVRDTKYGYGINFIMNRSRIEFDVTVSLSTLHQQLDTLNMLKMSLPWGYSTKQDVSLDTVIPKSIIHEGAIRYGLTDPNADNYVSLISKRINQCSAYPITYRSRNATYTDEWFMHFRHGVIITFDELNHDQGNLKNMASDSYNITFKVLAEYNFPASFVVTGEEYRETELRLGIVSKYKPGQDDWVPLDLGEIITSSNPMEKDGKSFYGVVTFKASHLDPNSELLNMDAMFEDEILVALRKYLNFYDDTSPMISFKFTSKHEINGDVYDLIEGDDYNINWYTMKVELIDANADMTYKAIIYIDYGMYNEIVGNDLYNAFDVELKPNEVKIGKIPVRRGPKMLSYEEMLPETDDTESEEELPEDNELNDEEELPLEDPDDVIVSPDNPETGDVIEPEDDSLVEEDIPLVEDDVIEDVEEPEVSEETEDEVVIPEDDISETVPMSVSHTQPKVEKDIPVEPLIAPYSEMNKSIRHEKPERRPHKKRFSSSLD